MHQLSVLCMAKAFGFTSTDRQMCLHCHYFNLNQLENSRCHYVLPDAVNDDLLCHIGWYFRGESEPRPNWCGFMQDVTSGSHLPASDIRLLSMIDMNPSDRSCILSTLLFTID